MDDSISPDSASDTLKHNAELPVPVDTLSIGGQDPDVGDPVTFKVGGSITRVVNETAYVRIETVNDLEMRNPIVEPSDGVAESDRLRSLSETLDMGSI